MWIINVILLLLILIGFLLSYRYREEWIECIDRKEHKLYLLYPFACLLLNKSSLIKNIINSSKTQNAIKALHITSKPDFILKQYWCKRLSQIILTIILFQILSLFAYLYDISNTSLINSKFILRPDYDQGSNEVKLKVNLVKDKVNREGQQDVPGEEFLEVEEERDITIRVKERRYTSVEVDKLFTKAFDYLEKGVLGDNKGYDAVIEDLNFTALIPGTSIKVRWIPKDSSVIQPNGEVHNDSLEEDGVTSSVTAVLQYYQYEQEKTFHFHILPRQYTEDELFSIALVDKITALDEESLEEEMQELPKTVGDYDLRWSSPDSGNQVTIFILGVVLTVILWVQGDQELEQQMKKRKAQMLLDYPEIINKFALLVNAGMTIKQAWYKIAEDYSNTQSLRSGKRSKRYAYEEMLSTTYELKLGVPELNAYEQYGRRTGLIPYMKFSSLVSQNLKKGMRGFTEILIYEAAQAFEHRKETAKRLGEEAGTKLLLPMMILMIIVFLIIMIPAFMAFRI